MPVIKLDSISEELSSMVYTFHNSFTGVTESINGMDAAVKIISSQGKNKGCLRASKPKMNEEIITRVRYGHASKYRTSPLIDCASAQIWRYVAFEASPLGQHHCLPVMADFDSPFDMTMEESRSFAKWCQSVADIVLTTIASKPGLDRWGHALGYF